MFVLVELLVALDVDDVVLLHVVVVNVTAGQLSPILGSTKFGTCKYNS